MKSINSSVGTATLVAAILVLAQLSALAVGPEEQKLIEVLRSEKAKPVAKDKACVGLKVIGTAAAVPALAALLEDEQLSQSARNVLEVMPAPEAGDALIAALPKTTGRTQTGIVMSLGIRREAKAIPDLAKLLDAGGDCAIQAARALGHIANPDAEAALYEAWRHSAPGPVHDSQSDGLMACGYVMMSKGESPAAEKLFQEIYEHEQAADVRAASFRGLVLASGKKGLTLLIDAIKGNDGPIQTAALQLAGNAGGPATTEALGSLLRGAPPGLQIALLECLRHRGDHDAASYAVGYLDSPDADVRMAVIHALGDLGAGAVALPLAKHAATTTGPEQAASREALVNLRKGVVTDFLVKPLDSVDAPVKIELIRALGDRGDSAAAPRLLALAQTNDDSIRSASYQALALAAGPAQVPDLVKLASTANGDDARGEAAEALGTACQHIEARRLPLDLSPLVAAAKSGEPDARAAMLGVCGGLAAPETRDVLRGSMDDSNPVVRGAAVRALCASTDEQLLPDMLTMAGSAKEENFRVLSLRGAARLVAETPDRALPRDKKIDAIKTIRKDASNTEGKRLALSTMEAVPDVETLQMADPLVDDAEVKVEASDAVIKIAGNVGKTHRDEAVAALKHVLAAPANDTVRDAARAALKKLQPDA